MRNGPVLKKERKKSCVKRKRKKKKRKGERVPHLYLPLHPSIVQMLRSPYACRGSFLPSLPCQDAAVSLSLSASGNHCASHSKLPSVLNSKGRKETKRFFHFCSCFSLLGCFSVRFGSCLNLISGPVLDLCVFCLVPMIGLFDMHART